MKQIVLALFVFLGLQGFAGEPVSAETAALINAFEGRFQGKTNPISRIDDRTFLRRVYVDITGRLPQPEQVRQFVNSTNPDKRKLVIDQLVNSEAYVDRWTTFVEDMLRMHRITDQAIWRNPFHNTLRGWVSQNMPWNEMVTRLLTDATNGVSEGTAFHFWMVEYTDEDFRLDFLDDHAAFVTRSMLGVTTTCISCHDGAYHLENVNKGLAGMTRSEFHGMAALLSKTYVRFTGDRDPETDREFLEKLEMVDLDDPNFSREDGYILVEEGTDELPAGEYLAESEAGDGMRPPRFGGVIEPRYLFTGEAPGPDETRRQALARMVTADRQFARNMVNRVWAHFFGQGFVEPVDGWDMGRVDPVIAEQNGTTVQPLDYPLMEYLTSWFIKNDYDLKALVTKIANTSVYQADFADPLANLSPHPLWRWTENNRVRRLEAEAIVDGINDLLKLPRGWVVTHVTDRLYTSAWQLPGTDEPNYNALFDDNFENFIIEPTELGFNSRDHYYFYQYLGIEMLENLGRGNAELDQPRGDNTSITNALSMLNSYSANWWIDVWYDGSGPLRAIWEEVDNNRMSRQDAVTLLVQTLLFREPTDQELSLLSNAISLDDPALGVINVTYALINHPDFLYRR